MGVDWYPCKLDENIDRAVFDAAVKLNHRCFLFWQERDEWYPYLNWSKDERDRLQKEAKNSAELSDSLVFKFDSHRVTVIGNNVTFPVEWRMDAFRTIPPWELPDMVDKWKTHWNQVIEGKHRGYLFEWFLYELLLKLRNTHIDLIDLTRAIETEDANWTKSEQLADVRDQVYSLLVPDLLPPPIWSNWQNKSDYSVQHFSDPRYLNLTTQFEIFEEVHEKWNRFGRSRTQRLSTYLEFDWLKYEQGIVDNEWPQEFFDWVQPYIDRGFGLYRDC